MMGYTYIHTHVLWYVSWKTSSVTFPHFYILNSINHKALFKSFIEFFFNIVIAVLPDINNIYSFV